MTSILFVFSTPTLAEEEKVSEEAEETSQEAPIPEVLDVHERDAEMYRFEFTPYFGAYIGDTLQNSLMYGGLFDVRLTPRLSLGADFGWTRIAFDPAGNFGSTVTNKNLYSIQGLFTVNLPAAFLSRKNVVETDFFTTLGGGVLRVNGDVRGAGFVGGGMKTYVGFARWLAFRVELRSYFSSLNSTDGTDFTSDWTLTVGPTFMIPPRLF